MQYGMVIDLERCMGCQTCATSCKLANNLPSGNWWNTVRTEGGKTIDTASGDYPNCELQHYPVACQHCKEPACVAVCPTGATYKDEETGLVMQDPETCIGCKSCIEACPYAVRRGACVCDGICRRLCRCAGSYSQYGREMHHVREPCQTGSAAYVRSGLRWVRPLFRRSR